RRLDRGRRERRLEREAGLAQRGDAAAGGVVEAQGRLRLDRDAMRLGAGAAAPPEEQARGLERLAMRAARGLERRERERGVGGARVGAHRLAQFGDRARLVAELAGGEAREVARARVVGPAPQARVEGLERAARVAARERDAAAQQLAERRLLEAGEQGLGLVEPAEVAEQVAAQEEQRLVAMRPRALGLLDRGERGLGPLRAALRVRARAPARVPGA